jgi:bacterioferritin-associated ferredoxin
MPCFCLGFSQEEIERMVFEGEYQSMADLQSDTFIGTGCGRCLPVIDTIFTKKNQS